MLFLAPAKINLTLDILEKRADGYHEVDMIMQSVSLVDELEMEVISEGISLTSDSSVIPLDSRNLVWQAAELLQKRFGVSQGIRIHLKKNIPVEAGLAGGSSDAATTLRGLNLLWGLNLPLGELEKIGAELGSDIPFCIRGGTMRATGRGEILERLPGIPKFSVLLIKPTVGVSTARAYQKFGEKGVTDHPDMAGMMEAISQGNREGIQKKIKNVFEEWVPEMQPIILEIMERLKEKGAKCVGMSGSGPTVFVLTDSAEELKGLEKIVQPLGTTWICKTLSAEEIQ
jgi:4-diphosphocytidyl-2-C-methyl-D-erythritol kinase